MARRVVPTAVTLSLALATGLAGRDLLAQPPSAQPPGATAPPPVAAAPAATEVPPPGGYPGYPPPGYAPPPQGAYGAGPYPPPPGYPPPPYYYYPPSSPPPPPPPPVKRYSTAMMVSGIVLSSVGLLGVIGGSALYSQPAVTYDCNCIDAPCDCGYQEGDNTAGTVLLVVGGVLAAGGVPLIIIGARKVPVEPEKKSEAAALVPEISIGPSSASLRWSF